MRRHSWFSAWGSALLLLLLAPAAVAGDRIEAAVSNARLHQIDHEIQSIQRMLPLSRLRDRIAELDAARNGALPGEEDFILFPQMEESLNTRLQALMEERDAILKEPFDEAIAEIAAENADLRERMARISANMSQAQEEDALSAEDYERGVDLLRRLNDKIVANEGRISVLERRRDSSVQDNGGNDGGGNNGGDSCFLAGTLVLMADSSWQAIETLKAGDMVLARDLTIGRNVEAMVEATRTGLEDHYYILDSGLRTNGAHRFYTATGNLVPAAQLKPGDELLGPAGPVTLTAVLHVPLMAASLDQEPLVRVHNITVQGVHDYYVSGDGEHAFLVHDTCNCSIFEP